MIVKPFAEQGRWTQMHNLLFDRVMPVVSGNAFKVLCFIVRNTKGRHKQNDAFSYAEIMEGTGIGSDKTVTKALRELLGEELLGSPVLLSKDARERGASTREATRYALNPHFQLQVGGVPRTEPRGVENTPRNTPSRSVESAAREEVRTVENAPSRTVENAPRNPARYKGRAGAPAPTPKENCKERSTCGGGEVLGHQTPPPPRDFPAQEIEVASQQNAEASDAIALALCEVCCLEPDALSRRDSAELPAAQSWARAEVARESGGDVDEATVAAEILARFGPENWDRESPPRLSQIRPEWRRMGMILARRSQRALEVNTNGAHDNGSTGTPRHVPARVANDSAALSRFLAKRGLKREG